MRGGEGGSRAFWRGQRPSRKWEMGGDMGGGKGTWEEGSGAPMRCQGCWGLSPQPSAQCINPCLLSRIPGRLPPAPGSRQHRLDTDCPAIMGLQLWCQLCLCLELPHPPTRGSSCVTSRKVFLPPFKDCLLREDQRPLPVPMWLPEESGAGNPWHQQQLWQEQRAAEPGWLHPHWACGWVSR